MKLKYKTGTASDGSEDYPYFEDEEGNAYDLFAVEETLNRTQEWLEKFQVLAANKELDLVRLRQLLQTAHDKMDELNNLGLERTDTWGLPVCMFCSEFGYDGQGLKHKDNCILVLIRKELNGQV